MLTMLLLSHGRGASRYHRVATPRALWENGKAAERLSGSFALLVTGTANPFAEAASCSGAFP